MKWVISGVLARAQRPGYRGELRHRVPKSDVDKWLEDAKDGGIKSIICLLATDELRSYQVEPDLISLYREAGFFVEHIPVEDYQSPPMSPDQLKLVLRAFQCLPRPILIHCSAGFGRSRMAIESIIKSGRA